MGPVSDNLNVPLPLVAVLTGAVDDDAEGLTWVGGLAFLAVQPANPEISIARLKSPAAITILIFLKKFMFNLASWNSLRILTVFILSSNLRWALPSGQSLTFNLI